MDVAEHFESLRREGDLLAAAAAGTDPDTPIPTCPDWRMRDLVRHVGGVHRWATGYVADRRAEPMGHDEEERVMASWPGDRSLVDWFREGHGGLIHTLESADPNLSCWTFLEAPSPLAFWARRQAHETAIHRADAESPRGTITPFPAAVAVDGIEELLRCFLTRPGGRLRADPARTIHLNATDADRDWLVRIEPERVLVSSKGDGGDCSVHGLASDLYLLVWNRRTPEGLDVRGDRAVLRLWRESARIRWS